MGKIHVSPPYAPNFIAIKSKYRSKLSLKSGLCAHAENLQRHDSKERKGAMQAGITPRAWNGICAHYKYEWKENQHNAHSTSVPTKILRGKMSFGNLGRKIREVKRVSQNSANLRPGCNNLCT